MAAANTKKEIQVYAHWQGLEEPSLMGVLSVSPAKGKESFSFEYADAWLKSGFSQMIDPDLQLYSGAYYPRDDKPNFGVFPGFMSGQVGKSTDATKRSCHSKTGRQGCKKITGIRFFIRRI
jgi:serine/threonine-protein kinase HipA